MDSLEQFRNAGRHDLADKEEAELKILETYLPQKASAEELEAAVVAAMAKPVLPAKLKWAWS